MSYHSRSTTNEECFYRSVIFASVYRFTTLFGFEISDTPWTVATPLLWCLIEISAAIISACLPTLRPILRHISSGFDSSQAKSRTAGTDIVLGQTSRTNPTSTTHGYHRQDDTNLRPDYNKMASDVRVKRESRGDGESDEMPLHPYEIMVSRELHWTEERSSDNSNSNSGDNIRQ
ncbi:MAG: hypothetical protein M1834_008377 [Cirrosporium novae-zelandiae]|nr:MAG: hypothetical protein M1834_008377 [Cirrosporium novae-zelandiae]